MYSTAGRDDSRKVLGVRWQVLAVGPLAFGGRDETLRKTPGPANLALSCPPRDRRAAMISRRWFAACALFAAVAAATSAAFVTSDASARTSFQSSYTLEQNYSAALRLIRVDMGLRITEKDPEAAYIMFEYKSSESGNRVTPGSIEMVPQETAVQVVIQLPQMPQYHEEVLATQFKRKLQSDYGDPPRRVGGSKKGDAGPDADAGDEKEP